MTSGDPLESKPHFRRGLKFLNLRGLDENDVEVEVWLDSEELEMLRRLEKKLGGKGLWKAIFETVLQNNTRRRS